MSWGISILWHRPSDEEVVMNRILDKVIRRSDTVDKESLCVQAGQRVCSSTPPLSSFSLLHRVLTFFFFHYSKVWHIRLTIHPLADAGNVLDCACLAGIVALKHFRRPDVEVIGDEVIIVRMLSLQTTTSSPFNLI
jgi:exosome complex component RRP45